MGNGGLRHVKQHSQIAYAHLAAVQGAQNFDAGAVREHFIQISEVGKLLRARHHPLDPSYHVLMYDLAIANQLFHFRPPQTVEQLINHFIICLGIEFVKK